jgi:hypothetical protein
LVINLNFTAIKTKTLLLMCTFLGISMTRIFAKDPPPQPVVEGTKSISWHGDYIIWEDVFCNGEYVESFTGPMVWHNISHFVNG